MRLIEAVTGYEDSIRDYRNAFLERGDTLHGTEGLIKYEDPREWIEHVTDYKDPEKISDEYVPATQYPLIEEGSDKILGMVSVRQYLNDYLEKYAGHIGYSIAPDERRKGYATRMLALALEKCREIGLERVLVTCSRDNEGSRRTILKRRSL